MAYCTAGQVYEINLSEETARFLIASWGLGVLQDD